MKPKPGPLRILMSGGRAASWVIAERPCWNYKMVSGLGARPGRAFSHRALFLVMSCAGLWDFIAR